MKHTKMRIRKGLLVVLTVMLVVVSLPIVAQADRLEELRAERQRIQREQEEAVALTRAARGELDATQAELDAQWRLYERLINEIAAHEATINQYEIEIAETELRYQEKRQLLEERLVYIYRQGGNPVARAISGAGNVTDMMDMAYMLSLIVQDTRQLADNLRALRDEIDYRKTIVEREKERVEARAESTEVSIEQLRAINATLQSRVQENEAEEQRLQEENTRLAEEIAREITERQNRERVFTGGRLLWPVPGHSNISSGFVNRINPISGRAEFHTGIDIPAPSGTAIVAAAAGTVISAGSNHGWGLLVVLDHGSGLSTWYAHCSSIAVRVGENVEAGQVIARVGTTGFSTGNHLHFEVRQNGNPQNPLNFVR